MPLVHKLPESISQKIAAGEIVSRPESIVKELVENALDANPTVITIVVKQAGKVLIQVSDDGDGMAREDAELAIERHATSKLAAFEDLDRLTTYGFRGEALAAIVSVSQCEIRTRRKTDELGTYIKVEGGIKREVRAEACDEGTSIYIKNLFFNVPARRKFMKSEATEFKHIVDTVTRAALTNLDVRFVLISDYDLVFDLPAFRPLPERIEQIFGQKLRQALIPIESVTQQFHLHGFISAPSFVKRVRTEQMFFVNNRPVHTSRSLAFALTSAYEHLVEKGTFPSCFLYVDIDPSKIDVNVHPQKLEIKFDDERAVVDEIRRVLADALQKHTAAGSSEGAMAPEMTIPESINKTENTRLRFPEYGKADIPGIPVGKPPVQGSNSHTIERIFGKTPQDLFGTSTTRLVPGENKFDSAEKLTERTSSDERSAVRSQVLDDRPTLWQLHNKYIFCQIKTGLMIVDQHVAHERILYERILSSLENESSNSQELLFPQPVDLLAREVALVRELHPQLEKIGFHIRFFGGTNVVIDSVPADVKSGSEETILREMLESYEEYERLGTFSQREALAAGFSCRAAIKSGDKLSTDEMRSLIEQLFGTKMPYVCPHGRPIVIKLTLDELDRRFGRTPVAVQT